MQGQTGIGKSTFVKKLLVDWVEVNKAAGDEQAAVLKNFELVVAVNLKEVSKCQSLKDVIRLSNVFAKEDKYMTEGLVDYISNNQEKVLLIFDGYDEYRSGCDSEIYEIFSGNSLRSCCVLITTRISKADELRGSEDLHAEITGFSQVDREDFMRRFLNSEEVSKLKDHLYWRGLEELAKVPLLLLLFCILWREGQSKSFPNSKTKLYMEIVQFILNHSRSKQTADKTKTKQYVELKSFKEILSEIGKVALQSLLKDDHLFEYSQLSDSVCCDESIFIGLLQITEYSETLRPVGMVSFIHKSIQEFLAAWYITYRCIPEGENLDDISVKLEECLALGNVFQFICGLSKDGASTVFRHFKSVRISDPSLDLSKAMPDVENETDEPLSDVTERQRKFINLVLFSFAEVESEDELSSSCLDSLGNFLLVSDSFPNYLLEKAIDTNSWSLVLNERLEWIFGYGRGCFPTEMKKMKDDAQWGWMVKILLSKGSQFLKVAQFLTEFKNILVHCSCRFSSVLCFRNGQVFFYVTHLKLWCKKRARLFTDNVVAPHAVHSTSGQLSVKFLKTLECGGTLFSMKSLGAVIKRCNHLERIVCKCDYDNFDSDDSDDGNFDSDDSDAHDSVLEQVQNPDRCSLSFKFCALTSTEAVKLASLLPRFGNVTFVHFSLVKCSTDAVTRLVAAIKHKTLKGLLLEIGEINMMSAVVEVLCQSLPELLPLQRLRIRTLDGCSLLLYNPVDLDDRWWLPRLARLEIRGLTDSYAEAVSRLIDVFNHNFLRELKLEEINLTPAVAEVLVQLLPKLSVLETLKIKSCTECSDEAVTRLIEGVNHKTLKRLGLCEMNLTSVVAESLGRLLPELSSLEGLVLSGSDGCNLRQMEIEAMFGRFSRPSSLRVLSITRFSARGSLASLAKNLCYFPCVESLQLQNLDMGKADLSSFLENLKYIPDLQELYLRDIPLRQGVRLMAPYLLQQKKLVRVQFRLGDASEEYLNYVQKAVKEKRPQLRIEVHGSTEFLLLHEFSDFDFRDV